jgi:hypothetical protein
MEETAMASDGRNFLNVPTAKVLWTAFFAIIVFMALGGLLYYFASKGFSDYLAKVGDCFIQGALISILFALLKAMIDKPDWRQVFSPFLSKAPVVETVHPKGIAGDPDDR